MIYFYSILLTSILLFAIVMAVRKRGRLRAVQAMFRFYNQSQDVTIIQDWIRKKDVQGRLADVLDYLAKIEDAELALAVIEPFHTEDFTTRQTRVMACKVYTAANREKEALDLAFALARDTPDDSTLDIYLDVNLTFGKLEDVRRVLIPRLEQKMEGTIFKRHHARLLFAEGKKEEALEMMHKIVNQDFVLYKNTFAPTQKRQIYEQYVAGQKMLDHMEAN
ncbi:MAG: hypothetical protein QNK37_08860 [Acidobacteriota bacterium]|nr:hypothetical protein [Acidobacteriota bacterium]